MENNLYYLKPNVVIEPLIDSWYAWSHLISPATAAQNIKHRHLKIMNSYIQAPLIHAAAVKDPKMLGGPFMDLGGKRVDEIIKLKENTLVTQKDLLELSDAITELDHMLKEHGKGYSLEPLYEKVPEPLKGFVELVYDLNDNPAFRFFEPLLYTSEYYKPASQSVVIWMTENDERPFVLSTPRLEDENVLHLQITFSHLCIDELAKMKRTARSLDKIRSMLKLPEKDESLFMSFFTQEPYIPYEPYKGDKIRMRYFGHACILIETNDIAVLVDPLISYYGYTSSVEHFSDYDLPDVIDYVLITHNHQDHVILETLLALRHKVKNIVIPRTTSGSLQDPSLKHMFNAIGFDNVIEIGEMESIPFSDCVITGIPFIGEHSDLNIQCKICFHMRIKEFTVLFVADSCNVEPRLYQHVQKQIGNVDIIFLGMECEGAPLSWLYGPLMSEEPERDKDRSRTLSGSNFKRGKALVDAFCPKETYVYAMGLEPWLEFISSKKYTDQDHPIVESNKLVDYCKEKGIMSERLFGEKELLRDKALEATIVE